MDNICLVEKCKSGDRNAFGLLYQTYLPSMRKVVAHYIHNSDTVWDILHDGFIIAITSINTLNDNAKVEAWLTTIMKNLSLQYIKEESSHSHISMPEIPTRDNIIAETRFEDNGMTFEELISIIDKLPEGYGKVFRLAVLDGLSHKDIGNLLGIAPHSSSSQLTHAKAMLRRMIVKYRAEIGVLSIIGIILFIWHGIFKSRQEEPSPTPIISKNDNTSVIDSITVNYDNSDSIVTKSQIYKTTHSPKQKLIANIETATENVESAEREREREREREKPAKLQKIV